MNYALDTSVVVRLLMEEPPALYERALGFVTEAMAAGAAVYVSDLTISETYFALQHHFGIGKSEAIEALRRLLNGGEFYSSGHAADVLALPNLASAKPGFVDRLLHADAVHSHCKWVTFEKSAAKLPGTLVLKNL